MQELGCAMEMSLRPEVRAAMTAIAEIAEEYAPTDVAGSRRFYRAMAPLAGEPEPVHHVEDRVIPGQGGPLRLRLYRPAPGVLPATLFFHGGWFFMGDLDSHDTPLRALANAAGCVVVAVDYRLAPENPCPAAPDDCSAAAEWLVRHADELHVDPDAIGVCGDSAGGALAAVVARRARDAGLPRLCHQILVYPAMDPTLDTPSWRQLTDAPVVSRDRARQAWSYYLPQGLPPVAADGAPGAADELAALPPTLVITAEYDPLRDEGEAYAEALREAGVSVVVSRYPGMIHGFFQMAGVIGSGRTAIEQVASSVRESCSLTALGEGAIRQAGQPFLEQGDRLST